ncbi:MAG: glycosyltransferase [Candidatus Hodarchaeota archaeon]
MSLINQIQDTVDIFLNLIGIVNLIIIILIIIIGYHIVLFFLRDKKYINTPDNNDKLKDIKIKDLKETPLVNFIVPAWKEGDIFKGCLLSINKLSYPKLRVIINAGGSQETIEIAESFKEYQNFNIIYQKAGEGKLKAINDALKLISEGLVYLIDADIYLDDNILLQMIYSITNKKESVVISAIKPHPSIQNKDLVKYLYISRNFFSRRNFSVYSNAVSQNTVMSYNVIENVNQFSVGKFSDDGLVIGSDIRKKGYKIFTIHNNKAESFHFPIKIKDYINLNLRWLENYLYSAFRDKKIKIINYLILVLVSIIILITPLLFFFNIYLFFLGMLLFLSLYLKRIRKIIFFKLGIQSEKLTLHLKFFIKLVFYLYIDLITNIIVAFEMLFYRKGYKKRKNFI